MRLILSIDLLVVIPGNDIESFSDKDYLIYEVKHRRIVTMWELYALDFEYCFACCHRQLEVNPGNDIESFGDEDHFNL